MLILPNVSIFGNLLKANAVYRLFAFWDSESEKETLVVGTHGFVKKTNKTPPDEIRKAERIRNVYFEEKGKTDK